jgi:hypothetical protein
MEGGDEFVCEYIGVQPLAKDYDRCPLYQLQWRSPVLRHPAEGPAVAG